MMDILAADNLRDLSGIRHGFFTRAWGDCGLIDATGVTDNRRKVAAHLDVRPDNLLSCYQIHSPDVITVTEPWAVPDRPKADAMVTSVPGIALGILTADCVPLLFADTRAGVIGAAHAGWRGAVSGVIENTVAAMEKLGTMRSRIHAAIGPCIWQNSYEVGPEFPAPFLAENPEHKKFFRPAFKSDRYMFNLPGYAEAKLRALGLASVEASPADTCADEARFFSHRFSTLRGEKRAGSLISVIVLAG
jgi:YfiH family protein